MTAESEQGVRMRVVLTPDVIGGSFSDRSSRRVLQLWRDRQLEVAVNRTLLRRYLKVLHRLGVSGKLLQWWAWWFTDQRALFCSEESRLPLSVACDDLARKMEAQTVIHAGAAPAVLEADHSAGQIPWIGCAEFLKKIGADSGSP